MGKLQLNNVKVLSDRIWWNDRGSGNARKVTVTALRITPDTVGQYYLAPVESDERTYTYKCSWQELSIRKTGEGIYEVALWSNSSQYVRSDDPFLVLEMTKEQLCEWHANDSWFAKESWYVVRRKGIWTTQSLQNGTGAKRCLKCRYLLGNTETKETHVCGGTMGVNVWQERYTVDEDTMATINLRE